MRPISALTAAIALLPLPAAAHIGHFGAVAGHDHWLAGAAIGAAVAVTAWAALTGRKKAKAKAESDTGTDAAEAEAEAETESA